MQTSFSNHSAGHLTIDSERALTQWLKDYAKQVGLLCLQPELQKVKDAALKYLLSVDCASADADQLLHELGIDVVIDYGSERIAWIGTTSDETAEVMLERYSQATYSAIRNALGIKYLWVLKLQEDLMHKRRDIYEARVDFSSLEEKPECIIIDL